jgi:hypothetical protein
MEYTNLETFRQQLLKPSEGAILIQGQFIKSLRELDIPRVEFPKIQNHDVLTELEKIRKYLVGLNSQLTPLGILRKEYKFALEELKSEFRFVITSYEVLILYLCRLFDCFDI